MIITPRQIHLDFHTSELIEGVGTRFTRENFQEALKTGHISSITVFAKCHHSNFYYPTKIGRVHPHLKRDLLGEMIAAAHEIGVKAPIYYTVGWSAQDAQAHPEWLTREFGSNTPNSLNYDVTARPEDPKPFVSWLNLCINNPAYQRQIFAEVREICENYPVDGFFFDIMFNENACDCHACREGMKADGYRPEALEDSRAYFIRERRKFCKALAELVHGYHPDAEIFYNGCDMYLPQYHEFDTHFELEDNPQVWGGYDKMPVRAKYFARKKKPYIAQSGKFHTSWGEYAGFKNPEALKYEVAAMLAYGARCMLGDQAHPSGEMDMQTYRNVGCAYAYAERIEDYCLDTRETARLGILLSDDTDIDQGLTRMLLETQNDFDIILEGENFDDFDCVVVPPRAVLSDDMARKLQSYADSGKALVVIADGMVKDGDFQVEFGYRFLGKSAYDYDYALAGRSLADFAIRSPFLFYDTAYRVEAPQGARTLAAVREPYFSRTYGRYCSHQNTPYRLEDADYPAVSQYGNAVYVAHNIPGIYFEYGCQYHRDLFIAALKLVYKDPAMKVEGLMSNGRARFVHSPEHRRYVFHALYGAPSQRGKVAVLEDFPTVKNVRVTLKVPERVKSVTLVPQKQLLPFVQQNGVLKFSIDEFTMHRMAVIEY